MQLRGHRLSPSLGREQFFPGNRRWFRSRGVRRAHGENRNVQDRKRRVVRSVEMVGPHAHWRGAKFGVSTAQPDSFRMPPSMSIYPQFMFHLRRSQFLQTANNSPDETAFYRIMLSRETVANSMVMIQRRC